MSPSHPTAPPAGWRSPPSTLPDLEVAAWADLERLPEALAQLDDRARLVLRFARAEVCATEGFEPSPLCVLRPLVPALQRVEQALADLAGAVGAELLELREGVDAARGELLDADRAAVGAAAALAGRGAA